MITQPISEDRRKHRFLREIKADPEPASAGARKKRVSISASLLDESLFLTPKEVDEYPAALRPLAAQFAREEKKAVEGTGGEVAREWGSIERRMDACKNDFEVSVFLDQEVFSVMEAHAQGRRVASEATYSFDAISANYAGILLKAMKLYRSTYRNPLAAHTLFLRAKTLSAESYVLGCTVALYNELLLSRWESFTDLFSISEILDEMSANGVIGDNHTIQILKRIQDDVEEWATQGPEVARALWVSEKERMMKLERAQREMAAKMEEAEMEQESLEDSDQLDKGVQLSEQLSSVPSEGRHLGDR